MRTDEQIDAILKFDALDMAERLTGGDYKRDKAVEALGISMHLDSVQLKRAALESVGDAHFSMDLPQYLDVLAAEGFDQVLALEFDGTSDNGKPDTLYIFWKPADGVLLVFDTYWGGKSVNGGKFYYNWRPSSHGEPWEVARGLTSSGSWKQIGDEWIWSGDHDCREAVRFHLRRFRERGELLAKWRVQPFMWLLHYMDTKAEGYDPKAITAARIAMLPQAVREAIEACS